MQQFSIHIFQENQQADYIIVHKETDKCAFEVYLAGVLAAVFEPDESEYIHIYRNPGGLDEEVIVQIADRIEAHYL